MGTSAAVVGASGYAGAELLRILSGHPSITVTHAAAHSRVGQSVASMYPGLDLSLDFCSIDDALQAPVDVVFCSLPHNESMSRIASLKHPKVIDLGGDFRLDDPDSYVNWYGSKHVAPEKMGAWVYGLPELNRTAISASDRVANPGCYAAAALLALAPLLKAGHISGDIHVDGKSGISGAGRAGGEGMDFSSANENSKAYSVTGHKHIGEMEQELRKVSGQQVSLSFVPHLVPMTRGIVATCVAVAADYSTEDELLETMDRFYISEPFVRVVQKGGLPETKRLAGTNMAEVTVRKDGRTNKVIAIATLDNLGKGAAGQAVQNANLMLGFDEGDGLDLRGMTP